MSWSVLLLAVFWWSSSNILFSIPFVGWRMLFARVNGLPLSISIGIITRLLFLSGFSNPAMLKSESLRIVLARFDPSPSPPEKLDNFVRPRFSFLEPCFFKKFRPPSGLETVLRRLSLSLLPEINWSAPTCRDCRFFLNEELNPAISTVLFLWRIWWDSLRLWIFSSVLGVIILWNSPGFLSLRSLLPLFASSSSSARICPISSFSGSFLKTLGFLNRFEMLLWSVLTSL